MNPELDSPVDWTIRFVSEIPAAVALFDRDRRYIAASEPWIGAFGLRHRALAGRRHDELCRTGWEALEAVQRHALAGDTVADYHLIDEAVAINPWSAILNARPPATPRAASPA